MRNRFDRQLAELNQDLIQMGHMIGQAIGMAISALNHRDKELAEQVIDYDDEINEEERQIENLCLKLLLQQQPVARDLRLISAALKMITDMERIGDQAADISEVTIHLIETGYKKDLEHIKKMAAETTCMVVQSVEAYVEKDEAKARDVIEHDDIVDDLFIKARGDVIDLIRSNPEEGACATDLLMIAKYFERIGDHACNIAEWVIFSITGEHEKKK
ncbi:MAG: phosphate signaling complex protein PhoU [Eubacterium sp.]|nr:phosphate signaling complex protein PhoU [Eubacterium sp.]